MQRFGNTAKGAQGMAFVAGRFKSANLLLGGLQEFCEVFLGQPGLFAEGGNHRLNKINSSKSGVSPRPRGAFLGCARKVPKRAHPN